MGLADSMEPYQDHNDLSRRLVSLSARLTMSLLFLLPLLFAHRPSNVQPRRSVLRRMPYYIGKRDSSLPLRGPEYPTPSAGALPGHHDAPPYQLRHHHNHHHRRPTTLDLTDFNTRYYRHFMKGSYDYPLSYLSALSGNGGGELFKTGRFFGVDSKPSVERDGSGRRREWELASILFKTPQSNVRDDEKSYAYLKELAADLDADDYHSDLYRTLISAAEDRPTAKHGLVSFQSENTGSGADRMFPANGRDDIFERNFPIVRHALTTNTEAAAAAAAGDDNDDEISRYTFDDLFKDDGENDDDDDETEDRDDDYGDTDGDDFTSRLYSTEAQSEKEW